MKRAMKTPRLLPLPMLFILGILICPAAEPLAANRQDEPGKPSGNAANLRNAAEKGDAEAQYHLGCCYADGGGVPKDETQAVVWLRKAADQGSGMAQFKLGHSYADGVGVAKDEVEGVKWYRKAAEQGIARAQYSLARCLDQGQGGPKQTSEALKWYRLAAAQGDPGGQYFVGVHYLVGEMAPKDYVRAYMWLNLAAAEGDLMFKLARDSVEAKMTPDQIAAAQRLSREWKPGAGGDATDDNSPAPTLTTGNGVVPGVDRLDASGKIDAPLNFPSDADAIRAIELKGLRKGGQVRRIRIAEDWAMCGWVDDPAGGESILHKANGNWKHVRGGGGVVSASELKKIGVPQPLWKKLLNRIPATEEQ
jgi:hypothetical protein